MKWKNARFKFSSDLELLFNLTCYLLNYPPALLFLFLFLPLYPSRRPSPPLPPFSMAFHSGLSFNEFLFHYRLFLSRLSPGVVYSVLPVARSRSDLGLRVHSISKAILISLDTDPLLVHSVLSQGFSITEGLYGLQLDPHFSLLQGLFLLMMFLVFL